MARQRYTHRRPLHTRADPEAVIRYYRTYRRCHGDTLAEFVAHYGKLWDQANRYGVKAYEGIVRLIDLFPEEWRNWITTTARLYMGPQPPTYELVGDMPGFLSAVSAGCFRFGNGPPPDTQAPGSERFRSLPPLALMRGADGIFEEGQSSRAPTCKRSRAESESTHDPDDEPELMGNGRGDGDDDEDPEEEGSDDDETSDEDSSGEDAEDDSEGEPEGGVIGDDDLDEEEPQIGDLADLGTEFIPPLPVGPPPEMPPPPVEPYPEELQQPLHPMDLDFYRGLYLYARHIDRDFVIRPHIPVAPVAAPEPPEPVVVPGYAEDLLSPIEVPHQGTRYGDPVWISSDSERD